MSELRSHFPGFSSSAANSGRDEGVADDHEAVDLLALNGIQHLGGIVLAALQQAHPAALGQDGVRREGTRPVHQRAGRHQCHRCRARLQRGAHALEPAVHVVVAHAAVDEPSKQVVLAPHDALGHPGRAAGVEHVEVVAAAAPWRARPADRGLRHVLVRRGPVGARARAVVDPQPALDAGHAVEDPLYPVGEHTVEHDPHRVGVVPQVAELVVAVAVVGVDRHQADFHCGVGGLDVLRRVVQVDRHLVLLRDAEVEQELRHAVGPVVELVPRQVATALCDGHCVGLDVRHDLPDVRVVPVSHARSIRRRSSVDPRRPPRPRRDA